MQRVLAFDIGATNIRGAIIDSRGSIFRKTREKTARGNKNALGKQLVRMAKTLLKAGKKTAGIGISSFGPLDIKKGELSIPPNFPFQNVPIVEPLRKALKQEIVLMNDCNAAVLGERMFGAGRKTENLVYITISTGIGGGAVINGQLLLGKDGNAMEVGHITINPELKLKCGCGKNGHWEALASGQHIPKLFEHWLKSKKTIEIKKSRIYKFLFRKQGLNTEKIFACARENDELCLNFIDFLGDINAIAIADISNTLNPSLILLGGAVTLNNKELIIEPIKKYLPQHTAYNLLPQIEATPLGEDVCLLGAAASFFLRKRLPI